MAIRTWQQGIAPINGGGYSTITNDDVITDVTVYFVDNSNARAEAAPASGGTERENPFDTIGAAYTAASAGDIIYVESGHVEALFLAVNKAALRIYGGGAGVSKPELSTKPATDEHIFDITANGVIVRGFILNEVNSGSQTTTSLIDINADHVIVGECDCYVGEDITMAGGTEIAYMIRIGPDSNATYAQIISCTFNSEWSVASTASGLNAGIQFAGATAATKGARIVDCEFDGGVNGFNYGAIYGANAVTGFWIENPTLTSGADIRFTHASSRGIICLATDIPPSCHIELPQAKYYTGGLVASTDGGSAVLRNDIILTGDVYWLDNSNADADDSNPGTERELPFETLDAALNAVTAANGDLIIIEADHDETIAVALTATWQADTKIFGLGSGSNIPSIATSYDQIIFEMDAEGCEIHGINFPASGSTITSTRVSMESVGQVVEGCTFTCGAYDTKTIDHGSVASSCHILNNTFTVSADGPDYAIEFATANGYTILVKNNSFNGDDYGFDGGAIYVIGVSVSMIFESNTFLNGADISIPTGNSKFILSGNIMDSGSRVDWVT